MDAVFSHAEAELGGVDTVIANAGIAHRVPLEAMTDALWDHTLDIDLKGVMRVFRRAVPGMRTRRAGTMVALSSIMGTSYGWDEHVHYSAAKAGVIGLVRAMAVELASQGIRVNGVAPGYIRTAQLLSEEHSLGAAGGRGCTRLHSDGPPRRARGYRRRYSFSGIRGRPLHHWTGDRGRRRPSCRPLLKSKGIFYGQVKDAEALATERWRGHCGFAALGGAPILGSMRHAMAQGALAGEQLRTIGLSVTVQDRILQDFKKTSGVGSVTGTAATYPDAQTKILSGSTDFDCWEIIGERLPALVETNKDAPIPTAEIKNWADIRSTFTTPSPKWPAKAQITGQIWADDAHTKLFMVPAVYNYDSIGYNPDLVSAKRPIPGPAFSMTSSVASPVSTPIR